MQNLGYQQLKKPLKLASFLLRICVSGRCEKKSRRHTAGSLTLKGATFIGFADLKKTGAGNVPGQCS
jgi:hypothetical protein